MITINGEELNIVQTAFVIGISIIPWLIGWFILIDKLIFFIEKLFNKLLLIGEKDE